MKRVLVIVISTVLCIGMYAQNSKHRRIEIPETDSLVYFNQKIKDADLKIYGDRVDGVQFGGDVFGETDYFQINVVNVNKPLKINRDDKGVFVDVSGVKDSCSVILFTAKQDPNNSTSFNKGDKFTVTLVKVGNPLKEEKVSVLPTVLEDEKIKSGKVLTTGGGAKEQKGLALLPWILLTVSLITLLLVGYLYFRLVKLTEDFKQIKSKSSKDSILKLLEGKEAKAILNNEISAELNKKLTSISTKSSELNTGVIVNSLMNSLEFKQGVMDLFNNMHHTIASPVMGQSVDSEAKVIRNDVTYDPVSNSFYPDSLSQHLFDIYEKNGQLYYSLTSDEEIRCSLVSGISYYDGCLKIEESLGFQKLVPIEDGRLNLAGDKYYVDTNNKLKVKIV